MNHQKSVKDIATDKLWRRGVLSFKLHSGQMTLYDLFYGSKNKVQTWLISRRFGKSFALCILALEQCIRVPNSTVKFLSPTMKQVNTNVRPLFKKILEDCPVDVCPQFAQKDYIYYFPNGSEIQLAGSDAGNAERLRGGDSSLAFIDEAGSCDNLEDTVKSILLPTTLMTNGKIILASTPPKEPDHEFLSFVEDAEIKGALIKKTIHDNPMLTKIQIKELFDELGGETSESSRRELLCEIIKDSKTTVIPEFTKELEEEIVMDWKRPPHYDMYEGLDLGFKDLTVNILGYFDFRNNKIIIEDEVIVDFKEKNTTIETLVARVREKEHLHFFNHLTSEQKLPTKRISDLDYIAINEIKKASKYEMIFEPVKKDSLDAMINFLREKLKKKEIIINPRCVTLIRHLRNAKWKRTDKSMMARSPDDSHYDALMALAYLIRGIDYRKNPFPAYYGNEQKDLFGNYIYGKETKKTDEDRMNVYRTILGMKKKGVAK